MAINQNRQDHIHRMWFPLNLGFWYIVHLFEHEQRIVFININNIEMFIVKYNLSHARFIHTYFPHSAYLNIK